MNKYISMVGLPVEDIPQLTVQRQQEISVSSFDASRNSFW